MVAVTGLLYTAWLMPGLQVGGVQEAVITETPGATPLTRPAESTVATAGCEVFQVRVSPVIVMPAVSTTSAANCLVAGVATLKEVSAASFTWMEMVAGEQVVK